MVAASAGRRRRRAARGISLAYQSSVIYFVERLWSFITGSLLHPIKSPITPTVCRLPLPPVSTPPRTPAGAHEPPASAPPALRLAWPQQGSQAVPNAALGQPDSQHAAATGQAAAEPQQQQPQQRWRLPPWHQQQAHGQDGPQQRQQGVTRFLSQPRGSARSPDSGEHAGLGPADGAYSLWQADSSGSSGTPLLPALSSEPLLPRRHSEPETERRRRQLLQLGMEQPQPLTPRRNSAPPDGHTKGRSWRRVSRWLLASLPVQPSSGSSGPGEPSLQQSGATETARSGAAAVAAVGSGSGEQQRHRQHDPATCQLGSRCRFCAHQARLEQAMAVHSLM